MIDALVRAMQTGQTGKPLQLLPVTVAAVNPLRVVLPGGSVVRGAAIAGLTYTSGQTAFVLYQEPAVGPVIPTV